MAFSNEWPLMMAGKSSIVAVLKEENALALAHTNCLMKPIVCRSSDNKPEAGPAKKLANPSKSFTQKEIRELFQLAHRAIREPELTILLAPSKSTTGRLLLIIPRAVGNAVVRNHLRRQIKSIFHEQKLYEYGSNCIVIARPGASNLAFCRLQDLLMAAFATLPGRKSS